MFEQVEEDYIEPLPLNAADRSIPKAYSQYSPLTVGELIEYLKIFPQDAEIGHVKYDDIGKPFIQVFGKVEYNTANNIVLLDPDVP